MQDSDRAEILCQLPPDATGSDAGAACFYASPDGWKWTAWQDNQPVAAFGLMPITYVVWQGWAFGTKRMRRTIPLISQFMMAKRKELQELGARRLEVRAFKNHSRARMWIRSMGGNYVCDLPDHGRNGETFELWCWTYEPP